jgi:3-hydroxyacyl-CoA dehydrogenase/enoyl-CoA hydratase/3-hydroxybutyryl-CoA epimerase
VSESTTIRWEKGDDGIVILTLDDPNGSANVMNGDYRASSAAVIDRLEAEKDDIKGVIITSAKKTFFAGADLREVINTTPEDLPEVGKWLRQVKANLRRTEQLGKPVVAAINGAALGGGAEIALATHHRIIADVPGAVIGFPEVQLGILPGAGGVTRTVRLVGIVQAIMGLLLQGQRLKPAKAKELGIVDEVVASVDELIPAAKAWIEANPEAVQPWDVKGYKIPGGTPSTPKFAANLPAFPANLRKQIKGANFPAPKAILATAVEGSQVDFDNALEIETRYFLNLLAGPIAKNMMQAFFFDLQRVNGDRGRPKGAEKWKPKKVVVLGAGMMGAGIAYVVSQQGIEVVLKDVEQEYAERGKSYSKGLLDKAVARGRTTQEKADAQLALIKPTTDPADAEGADLLIEAVFENPELKGKVLAEIYPYLAPDAVLGSNTSTLPITDLAENTERPEEFIGVHFFSPVDKMPLLEIIRGKKTNDDVAYKVLDFAKLIKKTPIVVNDSRGFFTSRVIGFEMNEGIAMLAEGIPAQTIEQATFQAGFPTGALQLTDELNLELIVRIRDTGNDAIRAAGGTPEVKPGDAVIDRMVELGRTGRLKGAGFYDYADGKRVGLWPGLKEEFKLTVDPTTVNFEDLKDRFVFAEAIESVKIVDEGVIESVADANIGSIFGIGYPPWTGGVLQFINTYNGVGPAAFVARAKELAAKYGHRFEPPASLVEKAEKGEIFADEEVAVTA